MHAPPGFGPRPEITGWYAAFDDLSLPPQLPGFAPDARRFLGATFDPSGLYRFVAVRDMLASEGLSTSRVEGHVHNLIESLALSYESTPLGASDWLNPPNEDNRYPARFMAFRHPNAARWQAALMDQDIITDVRGDVLRIGFGLYHDARDVDRLVGALHDLGDA
jgi:selenocysteine lyase/cysteine desulfurase